MTGSFREKLRAVRPPVRSLIFLSWIYAFAGSLVNIFIQLFLYEQFESFSVNVIATLFFYTGIMVAFCGFGYLASVRRLNIKHGFLASFVVLGGALAYLLHITGTEAAYTAMFFWGAGTGLFWLTVNTFELFETRDDERDFYSSLVNAGSQLFHFAGPLCATFLIWLAVSLDVGTFSLLFIIAPAIYLLGFFCFANIREYRPPSIVYADFTHFFKNSRSRVAQWYTLGTGFQQILGVAIMPLAGLFVLGTVLRVSTYETLAGLFSVLCVLALARYRTPSNRLLFYGIGVTSIAGATVWLGYELTFTALIAYTIVVGVLSPVKNVSTHVIDLEVMETGRKETDFYATMLMRDFFLWIWRVLGGLTFLALMSFFSTQEEFLTAGLYFLAASLMFTFASAYVFKKS